MVPAKGATQGRVNQIVKSSSHTSGKGQREVLIVVILESAKKKGKMHYEGAHQQSQVLD
jgi:hypothetical protein